MEFCKCAKLLTRTVLEQTFRDRQVQSRLEIEISNPPKMKSYHSLKRYALHTGSRPKFQAIFPLFSMFVNTLWGGNALSQVAILS